ncbi:hypothetical protein BBW65_01030 [Helicobacter enhydrae]|uniref:Polyprenyl synthetase family protein n=2 Tax=Helicobacter enhydrae TaxID=222136 RepID=A0A1B1U7N3_9HELI|nr:hypothetical protein BBW65_01030 [Helicobacter enhydrae]
MIEEYDNPYLMRLWGHITHGKMLRSRLILEIAGWNAQSVKLSAVVELIQLASLLHDDVIDNASLRRSKPSINELFGNQNAVMLGDALYSKAFYYLCDFATPIARSLSNAVCQLSSGEIWDVFLAQEVNGSLDVYFQMIEQKTASLIASSAECAAHLAGLDSKAYLHYGKCLGMAFQIVDDILDITQPQEVLGKPAMSDFKEGKMTLPYLLLQDKLEVWEQERLKAMCGVELDTEQREWVASQMQKHQCIKQSAAIAQKYANDAVELLPKPYNPKLDAIIASMVQRSF